MIQWHEVTWYSKFGAVILFLGVLPALCFYIGTQYQQVVEIKPMQMSILEQNIQSSDLSSLKGYYKTYDSRAELDILPQSGNKIKIWGQATYQGRYSPNFGALYPTVAEIHDNEAYVSLGEYCDLYLIFIKSQYDDSISLDVRETEAGGGCGFGNNVSFQDNYQHISTTTKEIYDAKGSDIGA